MRPIERLHFPSLMSALDHAIDADYIEGIFAQTDRAVDDAMFDQVILALNTKTGSHTDGIWLA